MEIQNTTILSIGECMVEMSPVDSQTFHMGFAGDTFNTAWYLARLMPSPWKTSFLSRVGTDTVSNNMVDFVTASGISVDCISRSDSKTVGLYMIHRDNGERSFSYWRENSAARDLASDAAQLSQMIAGVGVVYFSGITVAILRAEGRSNLYAALTQARAAGCVVVFDPNLRPKLWSDTDTMCAEITRAAGCADIVLPSFEDEADYFSDADTQATADRYLTGGAGLVIVKNGAGEVLASDAETGSVVFSPKVVETPVDTTAAGDSFNAGFMAAYFTGAGIAESLNAGAQLSATVISHAGALVEATPDIR
ncbi:MAG: sugar kinase [Rhodobacteraceae bacterium]|nr:sugar kinase [Paracoccaceae bacterium]